MERKQKNQYHAPACASLELEFRGNKSNLKYLKEYELNNKPNVIDMLIIRQDCSKVIESGLGAIFKKYNIIEYKSPYDKLNQSVYYRTKAYAFLFLAYNDYKALEEEITISFIRQSKPVNLMKMLINRGYTIKQYESGIYHVSMDGHISMQIIVIRQLGKKYKWITKLTDKVEAEDIQDLRDAIGSLDDKNDLLNAESVFDLMTRLNRNKSWVKEMIGMGAFRDLFKDEFEEKDKKIADLSEQLQSKDEQLQSKDEQLQSKDEQLQNSNKELENEKNENSRLRKEIELLKNQMKDQVSKIAML